MRVPFVKKTASIALINKISLFAILCTLSASCATTEKTVVKNLKNKRVITHYVFQEGALEAHSHPLPDYQPIVADFFMNDGSKESRVWLDGWDINHDGRIDMLRSKNTGEAAFDFDFDGHIDYHTTNSGAEGHTGLD